MNELEKFLGGLNTDKPVTQEFDTPAQPPEGGEQIPAKGEGEPEGGEGDANVRKNRRHRRLEEQLERERASNIALAERVKVLSETVKGGGQQYSPNEVPPEWIALYGDTPEARTAWAMQDRLIQNAAARARQEAVEEIEQRQQAAVQKQKEFEDFIDSELENLEDEFNVDLTSDAPAARKARREFLELVQKISPKDESGNIISYADFESTFDLYQRTRAEKKSSVVDKKKSIASESMQQPNGQNNKGASEDADLAFLRSQGIRV